MDDELFKPVCLLKLRISPAAAGMRSKNTKLNKRKVLPINFQIFIKSFYWYSFIVSFKISIKIV